MTDPEKTSRESNSSYNLDATPKSSPVDTTTGKDVESQDQRIVVPPLQWNGPDDPDNPLNWPVWKKNVHVFTPALISFSAYVFFLFLSPFMSLGISDILEHNLATRNCIMEHWICFEIRIVSVEERFEK